jgi:polyisoprenoid-binding protein YceI
VNARAAAVALLAWWLPSSALAVSLVGKPKVSFFAEGTPGALDIEGEAGVVTLVDDGTTIRVTVPMASVHTGIDLRDEHMNAKYVEVARFPDVVLAIPRASLTWPAVGGPASKGSVAGTFTAHGVERPVTVQYTLVRKGAGYRVSAKFDFDVSQHGIEIPSYLGVTVDPKMRAEAVLELAE